MQDATLLLFCTAHVVYLNAQMVTVSLDVGCFLTRCCVYPGFCCAQPLFQIGKRLVFWTY